MIIVKEPAEEVTDYCGGIDLLDDSGGHRFGNRGLYLWRLGQRTNGGEELLTVYNRGMTPVAEHC